MDTLIDSRDTVNNWMERFGVRFGVYKNGIFNEQLFPFDAIPRVISKEDWDYLERDSFNGWTRSTSSFSTFITGRRS